MLTTHKLHYFTTWISDEQYAMTFIRERSIFTISPPISLSQPIIAATYSPSSSGHSINRFPISHSIFCESHAGLGLFSEGGKKTRSRPYVFS